MSTIKSSNRISSIKNALNGIRRMIAIETNAKIHVIAALIVLALGIYCEITSIEWALVSLSIGFVLSMEALNTAIEKMADFIQPEYDKKIKDIKDVAAGAVLFSSATSIVIGLIIFIPKFIHLD